uniref:Uncharacterized protein TCIL3000_11_8350 n=1 Tax=Trypanosoma congolense (strain IL3000) TaxID=1068625 RepID=G0V160_TRYCI|nr:unnamed protein product [Trypanosoma congolense IL3000]
MCIYITRNPHQGRVICTNVGKLNKVRTTGGKVSKQEDRTQRHSIALEKLKRMDAKQRFLFAFHKKKKKREEHGPTLNLSSVVKRNKERNGVKAEPEPPTRFSSLLTQFLSTPPPTPPPLRRIVGPHCFQLYIIVTFCAKLSEKNQNRKGKLLPPPLCPTTLPTHTNTTVDPTHIPFGVCIQHVCLCLCVCGERAVSHIWGPGEKG